jgi:hypothetical protein
MITKSSQQIKSQWIQMVHESSINQQHDSSNVPSINESLNQKHL